MNRTHSPALKGRTLHRSVLIKAGLCPYIAVSLEAFIDVAGKCLNEHNLI